MILSEITVWVTKGTHSTRSCRMALLSAHNDRAHYLTGLVCSEVPHVVTMGSK